MIKYKLIKRYPGSPGLGLIVIANEDETQYISKDGRVFSKEEIENFPEIWERMTLTFERGDVLECHNISNNTKIKILLTEIDRDSLCLFKLDGEELIPVRYGRIVYVDNLSAITEEEIIKAIRGDNKNWRISKDCCIKITVT